ncbi:MAG: hypothetical protein HDP28_02070 [Clostridia bacterium]|nr:hypothetical protein [Clostridia bacterium]
MEKGAKRLYRFLSVLLGVLVFSAALIIACLIADAVCERTAHTTPSYQKEDITEIADKSGTWTDEEIDFLYRQTGLGKSALLTMKSEIVYENDEFVPLSSRLKVFQDALYYEGETEHELVADVSKRDLMKEFLAPIAPLEEGDIFVNSSTHTLGFRNGHAAIVLDEDGTVLESFELGRDSSVTTNGHKWFAESSNFIILRLKDLNTGEVADKDLRARIAREAREKLKGIPYSLATGIFSKKDQGTSPKVTHCSHLVWQAYKNFGYDIDSNGGRVVTPRDIARSPLFEVVQVYGFDPEKLW